MFLSHVNSGYANAPYCYVNTYIATCSFHVRKLSSWNGVDNKTVKAKSVQTLRNVGLYLPTFKCLCLMYLVWTLFSVVGWGGKAYASVARSTVLVGRQLGVRIRSHRPSEETEARPDQLYGEEECRHPWCELEVPPGLCGLSRSLR